MAKDTTEKQKSTAQKGGKADGDTIFVTSGRTHTYTAPEITPDLAYTYLTQNIHLRNNLVNIKAQVFPGEPVIDVIDEKEEVYDKETVWIRKQAYSANVYNSMQVSWLDCMGFGCSVKSPGYGVRGSIYELTEIRDLPAISFREAPTIKATWGTANALMPGIVYDTDLQTIRAWQVRADGIRKDELQNFTVIRDPSTPAPAGMAYCLPVFPVISMINAANQASNQQMMRTGTPMIFPQVGSRNSDLQKWGEQFIKRWGKNVGFMVPPDVQFLDPHIYESNNAKDRLDQLIKWVDSYFNPTTVLKKEGQTIGSTDVAALQIWNNFIGGTQSWIEYAYEEMLNPILRANGYGGLYVRIRLQRPSLDRSTMITEQMKTLIVGKAILPEELRSASPDLDLPDMTPEIEAKLSAQYAGGNNNPFAPNPQQFGNVQNPVERTEALTDTEKALVKASRQCAADVKRIVRETYPVKE